MQTLQETYKIRGRAGFIYKIAKRDNDVVLAEMYRGDEIKEGQRKCGHEVFVVQKYPDRPRPDGKGIIPAKELPPPDMHWGTYGFSYNGNEAGREQAEMKFTELIQWQLEKPERSKKKSNEK